MRAAIATASNDHRLGANEAPPAIMSVYLGTQLEEVFEQIKTGTVTETDTPQIERISIQWPSSMMSIRVAISQKKLFPLPVNNANRL